MTLPRIVVLDEVGSTMDAAHRLAADGALHGAAVRAIRQVGARGQHGRVWSAEPGGLWISVVGRPEHIDAFPTIALRIGMVLAQMIEARLPSGVRVDTKWPNDLQIEGRKIAGILVEARWSGSRCLWLVAGIGINVTNPVPRELADRAVALSSFVPDLAADDLMEPVREAVAQAMTAGSPLTEAELVRWNERDVLRGRRTTAPVAGTIVGLAQDGSLLIEDRDGFRHSCRGGVATATD